MMNGGWARVQKRAKLNGRVISRVSTWSDFAEQLISQKWHIVFHSPAKPQCISGSNFLNCSTVKSKTYISSVWWLACLTLANAEMTKLNEMSHTDECRNV